MTTPKPPQDRHVTPADFADAAIVLAVLLLLISLMHMLW
jgi:hypothetical protein